MTLALTPTLVRPSRRQSAPLAPIEPEVASQPRRAELDTIASQWQRALDAAERALVAAGGTLPDSYLSERRREVGQERHQTAEILVRLARARGIEPVPWLSPVPVSTRLLGLPVGVEACLFDLDGVLTDSALLHAGAWGEVLDEFLLRLTQRTGWQFVPFDRDADYRTYMGGRSRLDGVHAFLNSRGIRLPEGELDDATGADTVHGLAKRKGEALARKLEQRGATALTGTRRYLEAAGHAGLERGVVSASASTLPMLELANLATLVETHVDAEVIRSQGLRSPPAPDVLLVACRRLSVRPEHTVTFTHSPAGVAAGRTAGLTVVGVGSGPQEELLRGFGAEQVVSSLSSLLDARLRDAVLLSGSR